MTPAVVLRVLRLVGAVVLLGFMGLLVPSWVGTYRDRLEISGVITSYEDGAVVLSGEGGERYTVFVSSETIIRDGLVPAPLSALRPGRAAAVFGATARAGRTITARAIQVWG